MFYRYLAHSLKSQISEKRREDINSRGLCEFFFKTGKKSIHADLTNFIPVHKVVCQLNEEQTNILLSVYALIGCNTWCTFFGIGKKKDFKIMLNNSEELYGLADIRKEHTLSLTARLACV